MGRRGPEPLTADSPHRPDPFRFESLHGIEYDPTRPCRVRREVQSAEDAVDEKARLLEELCQLRDRVRADRGAVLPCPLPINHDLSGLVAASQDVERVLVEDDAPVVPDLPGLGRQGRRQGFAIEPLHEELPPRLEGPGHTSEHRAVVLGVLEVSEGREEVEHGVELTVVEEISHVAVHELNPGRGCPCPGTSAWQRSRREIASSIFGTMFPAGNWPLARIFFASATGSRSRNRWDGVPKSTATCGTSLAMTRCVQPSPRARTAAARSLSTTASTPTSLPPLRTTGMPPPPAAMTTRPSPSATSRRISSASMTSRGRGDGTTRRQPPRWSYTIFHPFAFFTTISSSRA